jgi:Cu/Ag efflux pump CusA
MQVYVGDRIYDLTVRFPLSSRRDLDALGNLPLTSSSGARIPLAQVASITEHNGEAVITREGNHRNLSVRIDLADRDLASYFDEVKQRIAQSVQFDTSKYHIEYRGQFENQERAQKRFTLILGLVVGLMLLLLYTEFGALRQAFLVLGILPLATLGGLIALFVTGETLNIATAVGFIALFGVAVQNGIIMSRRGDRGGVGALSPGADDRDSRNRRNDAGSSRHRRRQRCPARCCDRGHRGAAARDPAHAVHSSEPLLLPRTDGGTLGDAAPSRRGS